LATNGPISTMSLAKDKQSLKEMISMGRAKLFSNPYYLLSF
jgi:hypothetical protein